MINRDTIVAILVLVVAVLGGYFLMENRKEVTPSIEPQVGQQAINETIEFVSIIDKIHPAKIKVVNIKESTWSDRCLGLPQPGEMCAEVIVPGYIITLDADGQKMIFHTDSDGSSIRRDLTAEANT